ncbi:MAG: hypothetical protein ACRCXZ_08290 [Patescibacteria group bacterium]
MQFLKTLSRSFLARMISDQINRCEWVEGTIVQIQAPMFPMLFINFEDGIYHFRMGEKSHKLPKSNNYTADAFGMALKLVD